MSSSTSITSPDEGSPVVSSPEDGNNSMNMNSSELSPNASAVAVFTNPQVEPTHPERISALNSLILAVHGGELTVHALVDLLGPSLTDTDVHRRSRATALLGDVLHRLPALPLAPVDVEYLLSFFTSRVADFNCLPEVLAGLKALLSHHSLPPVSSPNVLQPVAFSIIQALFDEVHMGSLTQAARHTVYTILQLILVKGGNSLSPAGSSFLAGIITLVDGERDPRNLDVMFTLVLTAVQAFPNDLSHYTEELFDVTACYFPIQFTPPPNDPHRIDPVALRSRLAQVLTCSPAFAPYTFPFLLEKAASALEATKIDALVTLKLAMESFGATAVVESLPDVWEGILEEVFHTLEPQAAVPMASYAVVRAMSGALGEFPMDQLKAIMAPVLADILAALGRSLIRLPPGSPEEATVAAASSTMVMGKLLEALIAGGPSQAAVVLDAAVNVLLEKWASGGPDLHRQGILALLGLMIGAANGAGDHGQAVLEVAVSVLSPEENSPFAELEAGILLDIQCTAVSIVGRVSSLPSSPDLDRAPLVKMLTSLMATQSIAPTLKTNVVSALTRIGTAFPALVADHVFPPLFNAITPATLSHLTQLAPTTTLAESLARLLLPLFRPSLNDDPSIAKAIAESMEKLVLSHGQSSETLRTFAATEVLHHMLEAMLGVQERETLEAAGVVDGAASLLRSTALTLARSGDMPAHQKLVSSMVSLYLDGSGLLDPSQTSFSVRADLKYVVEACVAASMAGWHPSTEVDRLEELVSAFVLSSSDNVHRSLAAVVNKAHRRPNLVAMVGQAADPTVYPSREARLAAVRVAAWTIKGLLLALGPYQDLYAVYAAGLDDPEIGDAVASGYALILSDPPEELSATGAFTTVRPIAKQKFFCETFPGLMSALQSNKLDAGSRARYLAAIGHMLRWLPRSVIMSEARTVLPLLLTTLGEEGVDLQLLLSTVRTMGSVVRESPDLIVDHVESILTALVREATTSRSAAIRWEALGVIAHLGSGAVPHHLIYPFKHRVVRELAPALDDRRREVRAKAVSARNLWVMSGDLV